MNRRDFLKSLGFFTAGLTLTPHLILKEVADETLTYTVYEKYYAIKTMKDDVDFVQRVFREKILDDLKHDLYLYKVSHLKRERILEDFSYNFYKTISVIDIPKKYHKRLKNLPKTFSNTIQIPKEIT